MHKLTWISKTRLVREHIWFSANRT